MPNDDHDGPAPEELDFPETLRITIASPEEAFAEAEAVAGGAGPPEAVRSFGTTAGIRRLLTDRRLELVRSLMVDPAESISALAERLGRSYSAVHEDVEILADHGIVHYRRSGQSKQPFVPYERIRFDVTIEASDGGPDSEVPA